MDRDAGGGMSVTVGRLFPDSVFDYRFVVLGHNTTFRGAAGAAILNAELLQARGLPAKPAPENDAPAEAMWCDEPADPGDEVWGYLGWRRQANPQRGRQCGGRPQSHALACRGSFRDVGSYKYADRGRRKAVMTGDEAAGEALTEVPAGKTQRGDYHADLRH